LERSLLNRLVILSHIVIDISFNQPKFCPSATWNPSATTLANLSTIDTDPRGFFVDTNNIVYVPAGAFDSIQAWSEGNMTSVRNISGGFNGTYSIFVTINGNIYVDNGMYNGRVDVWTPNATNSATAMHVIGRCYDLFVDINNNLYCSLAYYNQVVKQSLYDNANSTTIAAGNGLTGATSDTLNYPTGIFVDTQLNLYVADCNNNRIQLFTSGSLVGTTVADNTTTGTITLSCPVRIVLDADGYLFISDYGNNRIVGSDVNGYRCITGCTNAAGSAPNQLSNPVGLRFDSYGNLLVVDRNNFRIQKFLLATNYCSKYTTLRSLLQDTCIFVVDSR
jgi:hypothetical protein